MSASVSRKVHDTVRILTPDMLHLGVNVHIMDYSVIGVPNEYEDVFEDDSQRRVRIGDGTTIHPMTVIYEGATLGARVVMEEGTRVGSRTEIGDRTRILYNAQVHDNIRIGDDCVIGGFIADNVAIGNRTSIFGSLIHPYSGRDPRQWDEKDEQGPTIGDDVLVAWGAVIIGAVHIGSGAYIYPNCVVTHNILEGEKFCGSSRRGREILWRLKNLLLGYRKRANDLTTIASKDR